MFKQRCGNKDTNVFNLMDVIMERMLNFYVQVYNHESEYIRGFIKNSLLSLMSYTVSNINKILNKFQITYADLFDLKKSHIKKTYTKPLPTYGLESGNDSRIATCPWWSTRLRVNQRGNKTSTRWNMHMWYVRDWYLVSSVIYRFLISVAIL